MSESIRCRACNGIGKHTPLGGIVVNCKQCNGLGYAASDYDKQEIARPKKEKKRKKVKPVLYVGHPLQQLKDKINKVNT